MGPRSSVWQPALPLSLALALAACAAPSVGRPPSVALGPLSAGYGLVTVPLSEVRWRPENPDLPSALGGPQRGLLGVGFGSEGPIQKLRLKARWLDAQNELQATSVVLTYSGSVPSSMELQVPAGANRVFELSGERDGHDGEATATFTVARVYSVANVTAGSTLSLPFDPDLHAAGRTVNTLLDNARIISGLPSVFALPDMGASVVALVNAKTGYQRSSNSYARVNPIGFRSNRLANDLMENALPILNGNTSLGNVYLSEGWSQLRLKAQLEVGDGAMMPLGSQVKASVYDLAASTGVPLDEAGRAFFAKVEAGEHSLRLEDADGQEHWATLNFNEGSATTKNAENFWLHPLGATRVALQGDHLRLGGLLPKLNSASGVPGLVALAAPNAEDFGTIRWVGLAPGVAGGSPMGEGSLGGNLSSKPPLHVSPQGSYEKSVAFLHDSEGLDVRQLRGGELTNASGQTDFSFVPSGGNPTQLQQLPGGSFVFTNNASGSLRSRGLQPENTGFAASQEVVASGVVSFAVAEANGSDLRILWEDANGQLMTRRVSYSSSGSLILGEMTAPVALVASPKRCSKPVVLTLEGSSMVLAYQESASQGAAPHVVVRKLSVTDDNWGAEPSPLSSSGEQRRPRILSLGNGGLGLAFEASGGSSGTELRFGHLVEDSAASSGWSWNNHGPHLIANLGGVDAETAFLLSSGTNTVRLAWRQSVGEIRTRLVAFRSQLL